MQPRIPYVGIIVRSSMKELVTGVARFVYPTYRWRVKWFSGWGGTDVIKDVLDSSFDGFIVLEDRPGMASALATSGRPVVALLPSFAHSGIPSVGVDERMVAQMAAEYLMNRGFENLAVVSQSPTLFASQRCEAFIERVRERGRSCSQWRQSSRSEAKVVDRLGQWLEGLPKPAAVFCISDWAAKLACDSCHLRSLRVPEDVAILGVDNDEVICQLAYPPLSSVIVPTENIGYQAAKLLEELMRGQPAPKEPVMLSPLGVATRASTDILATADPEVAAVLRFMRDNFHQPITITDVLRRVPVARRTLEKKFRAILARSPLEELRRLRLEHAKFHLARGEMAMPEVARASGFVDPRHFATVFLREVGCTPTAYRRRSRASSAGPQGESSTATAES